MLEEFLDVGNKLIEWQSPTNSAAEKKRDFGPAIFAEYFCQLRQYQKKHTLETAK